MRADEGPAARPSAARPQKTLVSGFVVVAALGLCDAHDRRGMGDVVHQLERRLELSAVVAISISAMLGSGIFVLPGLAAKLTGPSVFLAYLAAGLCVLPAALSKAELATAMPTSGGTYVYLDRTFGPLIGTVSGLGLWLSLLLKSAFALMGFGAYLAVLIGSEEEMAAATAKLEAAVSIEDKSTAEADLAAATADAETTLVVVAVVLLLLVVFMNYRGVRKLAKAQTGIVGIALCCLFGLVVLGIWKFDASHFNNFFAEGPSGFVAAIGFVFVSYAGVTKVAAIAEEIKRPERNLPLGILLSLTLVTAIYGGVCLMMVGVLDPETLQSTRRPVYELAVALAPLGIGAGLLGVVTMTSMANAGMLAASRFPFAMARDTLLPPALHRLHPKFLTPVWSIIISGAFMAGAILLFDIAKIAKLASAFMILIYGMESLAVLVLRETGVRWYKPTWRSPLYPGMQLFGIVSSLALLVVMGPIAVGAILSIAVPGVLLYLAYGRKNTSRRGVIGIRGRRTDLRPMASTTELPRVTQSSTVRVVGEVGEGREAAVLVALFGHERSPETLVELGAALAGGNGLEVVHITDVPEQTTAEAMSEEDDKVASVRRRVLAMADREGIPLQFDAILSRDVVETVHEMTSRLHCEWMVKEWRGKSETAFTVSNPLGWLKDHLPSNLATVNDAGVRYIRRILVHTEPGSHDLLVARTADHLGRINDAEVTFAHFVRQDAPAAKVEQAERYLDEVRKLCVRPSERLVVRGKRVEEAIGHVSAGFDLLITAESPEKNFAERLYGSVPNRITEKAACSVLRLQSQGAQDHTGLEWEKAVLQPSDFDLSWHLNADAVLCRVFPESKEHFFSVMAHAFADTLGLEGHRVLKALLAQEHLQNTGLGDGVALPHASLPELHKTVLGVFTSRPGVHYHARDGKPVDTCFVTLGPPADRHAHIILLAAIARMVGETPIVEHLRLCASRDDVVAVVRGLSQQMVDAENARPLQRPSPSRLPAPSPALDDEEALGGLGEPEPSPAT